MKRDLPNLFTEDEEEAFFYAMAELDLVDADLIETKLKHVNELLPILKDEWENDMLIGDAGDLLKKLGVVA